MPAARGGRALKSFKFKAPLPVPGPSESLVALDPSSTFARLLRSGVWSGVPAPLRKVLQHHDRQCGAWVRVCDHDDDVVCGAAGCQRAAPRGSKWRFLAKSLRALHPLTTTRWP
eukprot:1533046-Rhodomonas_salina.1